MTNNVGILGCGWLGLPLAKALLEKGYSINGSTTSAEKISTLKDAGIIPFLVSLSEKKIESEIEPFLQNIETLIINIPPKMRRDASEEFSKKIENLLPFIEKAKVKNVLFVSSTSVFSDFQGEVNEDSYPIPDTNSGKALLLSEQLLMSNKNFKTTVLRFGGLFGADRHPINYLAGREDLPGGNAPVNLIHLEDCIGIIERVIQKDYWGKILHGVHPNHPKKRDYYTQQAIEKNLTPPLYQEDINSKYKLILSKVVFKELGHVFQRPL